MTENAFGTHRPLESGRNALPPLERFVRVARREDRWTDEEERLRTQSPEWICQEAEVFVSLSLYHTDEPGILRWLSSAVKRVGQLKSPELRVALTDYLRSLLPLDRQPLFEQAAELETVHYSGTTLLQVVRLTEKQLGEALSRVTLTERQLAILEAAHPQEGHSESESLLATRFDLSLSEFRRELAEIVELLDTALDRPTADQRSEEAAK